MSSVITNSSGSREILNANGSPLPVTLLSGFLGSGKTTLLQHILRNKLNLKCAVIVNDMGAINIDASLVSKKSLIQKEEKLVQLENGCICCTLREDLLQEVSKLASQGEFDYLVIESTGISEPMQVAETFAMTREDLNSMEVSDVSIQEEHGNMEEKKESGYLQPLVGLAKLDTCVTVIDTASLLSYFDQAKLLGQEFENVEAGDERTVVDLLCDQIEFANVIILNKIDSISAEMSNQCRNLVQKLNPEAKILQSNYCRVDLKEILNTGTFDMETAASSAGWMKSLVEEHVPETLEYGIGSFVYTARRPFHPQRLFELLQTNFIVIENPGEDFEDHEHEEGEDHDGDMQEAIMNDEKPEDEEMEEEIPTVEVDQEVASQRLQNKKRSVFSTVFRSKGFLWIATRPKIMGEWSQAGLMITISNFGFWYSELDESMWPENEHERNAINSKFVDDLGDKRQEIVFIGQFQSKRNSKKHLSQKLDSCLLTDEEWKCYLNGKMDGWDDPWECWHYENDDDFDDDEEEDMI